MYCDTLQRTAHCNTLPSQGKSEVVQHTATRWWLAACWTTLPHTATHCNTLQHTTTHCNTGQIWSSATRSWLVACWTPLAQEFVIWCGHQNCKFTGVYTNCNTLQHTATIALENSLIKRTPKSKVGRMYAHLDYRHVCSSVCVCVCACVCVWMRTIVRVCCKIR